MGNRNFRGGLAVLGLTLSIMLPVMAFAQVDPFGFNEDDYSSWGIVDAPYPYEGYDAGGNWQGFGCFPVGNGLVFAHLGVDGDFNTLKGITGPGYQAHDDAGHAEWWKEGDWPGLKVKPVELNSATGQTGDLRFAPVEWENQSIQVLRGTAMVRTIQRAGDLTLYCMTYAVPNAPILTRYYLLAGEQPDNPIGLAVDRTDCVFDPTGLFIASGERLMEVMGSTTVEQSNRKHQTVLTGNKSENNGTPYKEWFISFRLFQPDQVYQPDSQCQEISDGFYRYSNELNSIPNNPESTYDYWKSWSAQNRQFDTGDRRLDDLMTQLPVIIEAQRDHYSGGVAPLVSYHGYWVRDHNGPILTYLANERFHEVTRMLRYHRAACLHYGHCWMQVPLDLDLSDLPGWQPDLGAALMPPAGRINATPTTAGDLSQIGTTDADWEGVTVEGAEIPSWIVLQHYWLWWAMHEAGRGEEADAFLKEAWPFIKLNLFQLPVDEHYGVRFHGDETYAGGALYSTYDREESGAIGYPNGYIPTDFFSFDNTLLHRSAAGQAIWMAETLNDDEARHQAAALKQQLDGLVNAYATNHHWAPALSPVTGQTWPTPFANIGLRPFWLAPALVSPALVATPDGVLGPSERAPATLASHYDWLRAGLWRGELPFTTPWSDYVTGHGLGYWLIAACQQGDKSTAVIAAEQLLNTAGPEGAWCEVLDGAGHPVEIYGRINRIRPWESGINYYALAQYLEKQSGWLDLTAAAGQWPAEPPQVNIPIYAHPFTEVFVITREDDYLDRLPDYPELAGIDHQNVAAIDAGLPFAVADLRSLLIHNWGEMVLDSAGNRLGGSTGGTRDPDLGIPFLFFDHNVRAAMDRRTMKDQDFWFGPEMTELLAEYEALGGVVIDADKVAEARLRGE
ncbi:hypothetical protein JW859_08400 [bacterium]|nr:hypothetical protein [bacterium]